MLEVFTLNNGDVRKGVLHDIESSSTTWLDFTAPTDEEFKEITRLTEIAKEEMNDWLSGKKRPLSFDVPAYSVIVLRVPLFLSDERVATEPCVIFVSKHKKDFITVHRHPYEAISKIQAYSEKHLSEIFHAGPTSVLYSFTNEVIDTCYGTLDHIGQVVEKAEQLSFDLKKAEKLMQKIFRVKGAMVYFHKALTTNREVLSSVEKAYVSFLDQKYLPKFRHLASSLTQLIELNSTYRDILNTTTEIYLTAVSNNLNVTIKKITSWGAVILVPSLIAGIFGMNFHFFDVLNWQYGLVFSFALMLGSVIILYYYFKRKDWI